MGESMNREIEFRAWLKKENKMVNVKSIHFGTKKIMYGYSKSPQNYGNVTFRFEDCELMQYTGLCDKNGTKIFEGDIVKCYRKYTFVVKFQKTRGGWFPFACGDGCGCCEDEVVDTNHCEIIGNIYHNPELLNQNEE